MGRWCRLAHGGPFVAVCFALCVLRPNGWALSALPCGELAVGVLVLAQSVVCVCGFCSIVVAWTGAGRLCHGLPAGFVVPGVLFCGVVLGWCAQSVGRCPSPSCGEGFFCLHGRVVGLFCGGRGVFSFGAACGLLAAFGILRVCELSVCTHLPASGADLSRLVGVKLEAISIVYAK